MWALAWGIPGFLLQGYGLIEGWALLSFAGSGLLCVALMYLSRAKGYPPMWGLWGLVPVMGPILLLLQPHRPGISLHDTLDGLLAEEDPHIRAIVHQGSSAISGGLPLLVIMAPIGILILAFGARLPQAIAPAEITKPAETAMSAPPAPEPAKNAPQPEAAQQPAAPPEQPVPEPAPPPSAAPSEPAPPPAELSPAEKYHQLHPGMTFEQVREIAGNGLKLISGASNADGIVKWQNPDKSFFAARFKDNRLERVTGLSFPPQPDLKKIAEELDAPGEMAAHEAADTHEARAEEAPEPRSIAGTETDSAQPAPQNADTGAEQPPEEPVAESSRKAVVRVGGTEKQERPQRKAQLPRYTQAIAHGPHDVYFHNETDATIKAGIRTQAKRGLDITIPPGGAKAVYLSNASYEIYYIDASQPYDLKEAGELVIASPPNTLHVPLH